jgi:hypothetical protein
MDFRDLEKTGEPMPEDPIQLDEVRDPFCAR